MAGPLVAGDCLALVTQAGPGRRDLSLVSLSFEARVTGIDAGITAFQVGDRFTVDLTLNDSVVDTNNLPGSGAFPGLVTSYTIAANPGNAGTWDPSGGSPDLPGSNFVTNAFGDMFTFQIKGTGFPYGGAGLTLEDLEHEFYWLPGVTDSGSGDTFAEQLGVPFGVPPGIMAFKIRFTDGEDYPEVRFSTSLDPFGVFKAEDLGTRDASSAPLLVAGLSPPRAEALAASRRPWPAQVQHSLREAIRDRSRRALRIAG
jgi:hypothetical protein